ncbi:hypothetical protein BDV59DRAFT_90295 [Aspergillus ambiguus]|uniref:uncharacterized protein n=1 Tax=Aspergillus ambiguus TaxID=176160 RepID=UPI003CCD4602
MRWALHPCLISRWRPHTHPDRAAETRNGPRLRVAPMWYARQTRSSQLHPGQGAISTGSQKRGPSATFTGIWILISRYLRWRGRV